MEILDLYDDNCNRLNETIIRGNRLKPGKNIMLSVIYIKNKENKYLIQKQSPKKGDKYSSTGGHVTHNEDGLVTIIRELYEELNIKNVENSIKYIDTFKYPDKPCIFNVYLLNINNLNIKDIKLQIEEVSQVSWLSKEEIYDLISSNNFLETHAYIFKNYIDK